MLQKSFAAIAKALGVKCNTHSHVAPESIMRRSNEAISPFEPFIEQTPTTKEWFLEQLSNRTHPISYFISLFPFLQWIPRYNRRWLMADIIAGCTLSLLVIPQGLSYAMLANLSPEFGLFTTLAGASLYWTFGTSKDISVGATAVISLLVGKTGTTITEKDPNFTREDVAKTHAFLVGCIFLFLGLLRLGWIIELIPHVAISAFVTAAAITIALGQVPNLLGIRDVNTKNPAYQVLIDTCKGLGRTKLDAAVGLTALLLLMSMKRLFEYLSIRKPHLEKVWNTLSSLRLCSTVFLYILISYLVNRNVPQEESKFRILGHIPTGFGHNGSPTFQFKLVKSLLSELPATAIVVIVEHIAIGKSLGQKNDYVIVPSQELVSIGTINLLGPFVGGYASTASFGGSALLSKAGVKTPLAGIFNAVVLILALYVLGPTLYWTPIATMSALIIHAVLSLPTPLDELYKLWLISPPDLVVYAIGLLTSVFSTLENGIYVSTGLSMFLLLFRFLRNQGHFLGRVRVRQYPDLRVMNPALADSPGASRRPSRDAFFRLDRKDASNPCIDVESPRDGVFIYRFPEGFNYINQAKHMEFLLTRVTEETRRTTVLYYENAGDRPWNEPIPPASRPSPDQVDSEAAKPTLKAVIFDFSTVDNIDTGAVDGLVALHKQLERWSSPETVEFHFASVDDRWVRRALIEAGFGYPREGGLQAPIQWNPVFTLAKKAIGTTHSERTITQPSTMATSTGNAENGSSRGGTNPMGVEPLAATHGINYPNFHSDLMAAVGAITVFIT
ncbi:sulfate permease [Daldinia sp. FL1419]|nr:sulfate permease [Daldinia sp. FL1419]